jgi:hypothetical protein
VCIIDQTELHAFEHPCGTKPVRGTMNNTEQPAQPNRDLVERAIVEVLDIAQRHGITPADFVQMLDSGMRMSDFLTAMDLTDASQTIDRDTVN